MSRTKSASQAIATNHRRGSRAATRRAAAKVASTAQAVAPPSKRRHKHLPLTNTEKAMARARRMEKVSVITIAAELGVGRGTIYRLFKCDAAPPRPPRWGRRWSKCLCGAPVRVEISATRAFCASCYEAIASRVTIYDRARGDTPDMLPENLRRQYSIQEQANGG